MTNPPRIQAAKLGTIFFMDIDGSNFTLFHEFAGEDGAWPYGTLTLDLGKLYGTTSAGGPYGWDTPFHLGLGTVLVKPVPLVGDANHDGMVSADDFACVPAALRG